jgi:FtsZ-binding cell division protein ZapB
MHSLKEFPYMMQYDKRLQRSYHQILGIWEQEADQYVDLNPTQLKKEIKDLQEKNNLLTLSLLDVQEKLESVVRQNKRYKNIVNIVEQRVPESRISELEHKLNQLINGMS